MEFGIRVNAVTMTVADYCNAVKRSEVLVDQAYQRNSSVWPRRAQSYLIETILLGYPMPKLALHQKINFKNRQTVKFVVDGQQRTNAIVDFFEGKLRLPNSLDTEQCRGRTFDDLPEELKSAFLAYPLHFDQFEAEDDEVVREYFRRINSFTTPLNYEERRHAIFQGNMKWFILELATRHTKTLVALRTINERQVVRMADHKLYAEIIHAYFHGVLTTNSRLLDRLYNEFDSHEVPDESQLRTDIDSAFNRILGWRKVCESSLVKRTHILYSLVLAVLAVEANWPKLEDAAGEAFSKRIHCNAEHRLLALNDAFENESVVSPFERFVKASSEKTNTRDQRCSRIAWLANAITDSQT